MDNLAFAMTQRELPAVPHVSMPAQTTKSFEEPEPELLQSPARPAKSCLDVELSLQLQLYRINSLNSLSPQIPNANARVILE